MPVIELKAGQNLDITHNRHVFETSSVNLANSEEIYRMAAAEQHQYVAQLRERQEGDEVVEGIAVPYEVETTRFPGLVWVFDREAFTQSLQKDDYAMLVGHDRSKILARRSADTVAAWNYGNQMKFIANIGNPLMDVDAQKTVYRMRRGELFGMSIGWSVEDDNDVKVEYDEKANVMKIRFLRATLDEFSAVTMPQFGNKTDVKLVSPRRKASAMRMRVDTARLHRV